MGPVPGLLGKGGVSPSERLDPSEWNRILQRLGLDVQQLQRYTDNLREVLYSEISTLLDRFNRLVDELEKWGVPRDLMLDRKCVVVEALQRPHGVGSLLCQGLCVKRSRRVEPVTGSPLGLACADSLADGVVRVVAGVQRAPGRPWRPPCST